MSRIEKGQIYLAIGFLIIGWITEINCFKSFSAGIFLGSGCFYFFTSNLFSKNEDIE